MDLTVELAELRAEAESRMRDTCTVTTLGASGDLDPVTGLPSAGSSTTVYSGKFRLRSPGSPAGGRDVAGDRVATSSPTASFPVSGPAVPIGAVVLVTGVPADDPAGHLRLNRRFRVTGLVLGTDMTAQRVTVEAVTG